MPLNVQKVKWGQLGGKTGGVSDGGIAGGSRTVAMDEVFAAWGLGPAGKVPRGWWGGGVGGVLFDLDGVLVETAEFHFVAWQRLAEELGVPFNRRINHGFRGVGRMECLEKLLGVHARLFVGEEKRILADRKNGYYLE